ncbi:MAG TPA: HAMP domain-containing sensor histidine kinase [Lachnospiraceae bacterium]|nr:HAMP domain-containing sensor histidine kinase [Lachnospiraceae bacterium]
MWYKISHFIKDHLIVKLALVSSFLVLVVYLLFIPIQSGLYYLLDDYYYTKGNFERISTDYRNALQSYILQNGISSNDTNAIYKWNLKNPFLSLVITDNTYIIYYSYVDMDNTITTLPDYNNTYKMKELVSNHTELSYMTFYKLNFIDGKTLFMSLGYRGHYKYYLWAYYASVVVCFFLFLLPFSLIVRRKTKYIQKLAAELHILEGGDLQYSIKEKGSDEIYQLAHGINQMRLSILEKQEQAMENETANRRLVTSLSHDLRTPLTSIIGYLEILKQHKYKDENQMHEFIEKSQEKAFVLKEMSDKLFEYFLVSQRVSEEYHMENIPIADLVSGLLDNQIFDLQNQGFIVNTSLVAEDFVGYCTMDVEFMQRVLDNILSNIRKHANREAPVDINGCEGNGVFSLRFENGMRENTICSESTGIGLKTCGKIMLEHDGELKTYINGTLFITKLLLPYRIS